MEFEWNIFPGFNTLQLNEEVKSLLLRLGETPENFTGRIFSCRCSTIFLVDQKTMKKNAWRMLDSYLSMQEDLVKDNGHFIEERMQFHFDESDVQIFRATTPLSRGQLKSKRHGKLSIHNAADQETIETIFRIPVSANQVSLYGAVAGICEEYQSFHERTGRLDVVMGQSSSSLVLSVIKTEVLLYCDDPAYQNFLLQQ